MRVVSETPTHSGYCIVYSCIWLEGHYTTIVLTSHYLYPVLSIYGVLGIPRIPTVICMAYVKFALKF